MQPPCRLMRNPIPLKRCCMVLFFRRNTAPCPTVAFIVCRISGMREIHRGIPFRPCRQGAELLANEHQISNLRLISIIFSCQCAQVSLVSTATATNLKRSHCIRLRNKAFITFLVKKKERCAALKRSSTWILHWHDMRSSLRQQARNIMVVLLEKTSYFFGVSE